MPQGGASETDEYSHELQLQPDRANFQGVGCLRNAVLHSSAGYEARTESVCFGSYLWFYTPRVAWEHAICVNLRILLCVSFLALLECLRQSFL